MTLPEPTENQLQTGIISTAHALGWRVAHFRPAQTQTGRWVTPVQADGAGFPDLVLVRGARMIFAEIKTRKGRVSPAQAEWIAALQQTTVEVYLWRTSHYHSGEIEKILRYGAG